MCPVSRISANSPYVATEDLSEEDQQLKSELDMIVERLAVRPVQLYQPL